MEEPSKPHCPTPIGYMDIPNVGIIPIACRRWNCPHCGKWRKIRLALRVANGFFGHNDVITWTLTQSPSDKSNIVKNFNILRRILKRKHNITMKFMWVKEFTPKSHHYVDIKGNIRFSVGGTRHLHILTLTPIDQDYLSQLWKEITHEKSYIVWVNQANIKNAGGYVFKYLTKAYESETGYQKNERRYGFSKDYKFSIKYERHTSELENFPLMGDFWEIIGHPRCMPYFHKEIHPDDYKPSYSLKTINSQNKPQRINYQSEKWLKLSSKIKNGSVKT